MKIGMCLLELDLIVKTENNSIAMYQNIIGKMCITEIDIEYNSHSNSFWTNVLSYGWCIIDNHKYEYGFLMTS